MQNETLVALEFIRRGFERQATLEYTITQKFFIMFDLAQGFERYFKLVFSLITLGKTGQLATYADMKKASHGTLGLLDRIVEEGYHPALLAMADGRWGQAYLTQDPIFRQAVVLLDDFGRSNRYYDLDNLGGRPTDGPTPEDQWEELETMVAETIFPTEQARYAAIRAGETAYEALVYPLLVKRLQWGLYAVTRLMIIGVNGDPTLGWPQHFLDVIFEFGPPGEEYRPYF